MLALVIATVLIVFASCGLFVLLRAIWQSLLEEDNNARQSRPPRV